MKNYLIFFSVILLFNNCISSSEAEDDIMLSKKKYIINYSTDNPLEAFIFLSLTGKDSIENIHLMRNGNKIISFINNDTFSSYDYKIQDNQYLLNNGEYRIYWDNDSLWFDSKDASQHIYLNLDLVQ